MYVTNYKNPNQFLALETIRQQYKNGGVALIRDVLGVKPIIPQPVEAWAIVLKQTTPQTEQIENIPIQNLGGTFDQVSESIIGLKTELHNAGVFTDLEPKNVGVGTDLQQKDVGVETDLQLQQNLRDLERAHRFIGTMSGQIKASTAKISSYDEQITQQTRERDRLAFIGEDIEDGGIEEINEELKELREQRDLQQMFLNRNLLPGIKTQFVRIKETVNTMVYFGRTLVEKIQTLFREQGITIVCIITQLVLLFLRLPVQ